MQAIDDKLYLFGGQDPFRLVNDLYCYSLNTKQWSLLKTFGQIPEPRKGFTMVKYQHYLLVYGGGNGTHFSDELFVLNTRTLHWQRYMMRGPGKRRSHSCFVYKDSMFLFGGGNGQQGLNDLWILSGLETLESQPQLVWELVPALLGPSPRGYTTVQCIGAQAVFYGGADSRSIYSHVYLLDLETLVWQQCTPQTPLMAAKAVSVGQYWVLFIGGAEPGSTVKVSLYDVRTDTWFKTGCSLPRAVGYHAVAQCQDMVFGFGGSDKDQIVNDFWVMHLGIHTPLLQL
ncbi:hypothetical protein EDD86DRAFT_195319 [Gorgonomyces haynaldii]|nr:hypothetical protein EDD86DRAFT_195319 [Gorgonomyces haynaldii]